MEQMDAAPLTRHGSPMDSGNRDGCAPITPAS